MYIEWKHKQYHCISLHSVHNINYFHFTTEQQMSEGSQSYPERSPSQSVNTIIFILSVAVARQRKGEKYTLHEQKHTAAN
jgi:hypothetical protein